MLALNHKLLDIKNFPRFRFPWEGYLKDTFTNPIACRFPVLNTIGLGLALSWRIDAVCPWQECFPKKCTSRGSNSDNISDRVLPDHFSCGILQLNAPISVPAHREGVLCFIFYRGTEIALTSNKKKKKKKKDKKKKEKKKEKRKKRPTKCGIPQNY